MKVPVNEPVLGDREIEYLSECVRTGWISSAGRFIEEFEQNWAAYCKRRYGIAVCNGTAALELAIAVLNLSPGDEVILPAFTIVSCAQAILRAGAVPVLVDADKKTWCMDVSSLESKVTPRTRAIMPVHIYGHPVDMDPLMALAERHALAVIEDASEAHGAEYCSARNTSSSFWKRCGSFGTASTFSFYANKIVTTGEGGMVLTDDLRLANRMRSLRNLCFGAENRFYHEELGFNFRMTNLQAAVGLAQLERIDQNLAKKRWIGQEYTRRLCSIPHLQLPVEEPWAHQVYWAYGFVINETAGIDATQCARMLAERGVETRPFFLGMHEEPALLRKGLFAGERYPVTERIARQGLYVPCGLGLTPEQLAHVCEAIRDILR